MTRPTKEEFIKFAEHYLKKELDITKIGISTTDKVPNYIELYINISDNPYSSYLVSLQYDSGIVTYTDEEKNTYKNATTEWFKYNNIKVPDVDNDEMEM
jgi:hypothetical protein